MFFYFLKKLHKRKSKKKDEKSVTIFSCASQCLLCLIWFKILFGSFNFIVFSGENFMENNGLGEELKRLYFKGMGLIKKNVEYNPSVSILKCLILSVSF